MLHLHGEIFKKRSDRQAHDDQIAEEVRGDMALGAKAEDGGFWRPHIVWFEEPVPTTSQAAAVMETAEIFILIGTSLAVYPAAGLIDFVKPGVTKYIIDKNIPMVAQYRNVMPIQKPATDGMEELREILLGAM